MAAEEFSTPSPEDLLAQARANDRVVGFKAYLDVDTISVEPGRVVVRLPFRPELAARRADIFHGGALSALADAAAATALNSVRPPSDEDWLSIATTDLHLSYHSGAAGDVQAVATVRTLTRRVAYVQVDIVDCTTQELRAAGSVTLLIRRRS